MNTTIENQRSAMEDIDIPLAVDLDGTLIRTDLLVEDFFSLLSSNPLKALASLRHLPDGKAAFKAHLADHACLDLKHQPFNEDVLAYIRREKARGRKVYLVSASERRHVEGLAEHLGLFDGVHGSTRERNLAGPAKAELLCELFGPQGFDYMGNDWVDLPVWRQSRIAIAVDVPPRLWRQLKDECPAAEEIAAERSGIKTYLRAIRVHQWLKNILVFLPLLASHHISGQTILASLMAAVAFSLSASSAYLVNDLLDLSHDRKHATKRFRPMASGAMPLTHGVALAPLLLLAALGLATAVSWWCLVVLGVYYATTLAYSLYLKRRMLIDVFTLAGLYTLRILAGAAAIDLPPSPWLLSFSLFFFLALALVKRYIELVRLSRTQAGNPTGRGYLTDDLSVLAAMAAAAGYISVLVLALYFHSPEVHVLYSRSWLLWLVGPPVLYWISRILMLAHRGELHDDPVVFAATDRVSLVTGVIVLAVMVVAL